MRSAQFHADSTLVSLASNTQFLIVSAVGQFLPNVLGGLMYAHYCNRSKKPRAIATVHSEHPVMVPAGYDVMSLCKDIEGREVVFALCANGKRNARAIAKKHNAQP